MTRSYLTMPDLGITPIKIAEEIFDNGKFADELAELLFANYQDNWIVAEDDGFSGLTNARLDE